MLLGGFDDPLDGSAPAPDRDAPARYRRLHRALRSGRVRACHDVSEGGLAVALAEMALGGDLGVDVQQLPDADPVVSLFAESTGRFVCELDAADVEWLAAELGEPVLQLGVVTGEPIIDLLHAHVTLDDARRAFHGGSRP
jgi:phosphoribosylformylglycinamidine synthase